MVYPWRSFHNGSFNLGSFSQLKNDSLAKKKHHQFMRIYMNEKVHYRYLKEHYKLLSIYFKSIEDISDLYCKFSRNKNSWPSIKKIVSLIYPRGLRLWIIHRIFGVYIIIKK